MADERKFADAESLRPVVRAAFGRGRALAGAERLAGGSKKGAYRLTMADGGTVLLYAWSDSEDYWQGLLPAGADDPADPFSHASGLALFEAAARRLAAAGARCPEILFTDRSGDLYPADIAVVEDVPGGSLEALLDTDPGAAKRPLSVLADWLAGLAAVRSPSFGKVAFVDAGGRSPGTSCERVALDRALAQLQEIAGRDRRAAAAQGRLEDALRSLAEAIEPRATWALVHGELGPDHILLDRRGEPVLIDVEGARYFDVETEHVWTRMRFGGHYARLRPGGLDEDRLRFYQLCMHLDLVAGPLRIVGTSHPEREWFRGVAEYHLQRALQFPALTSSGRCINGGRQLHLRPPRSRRGRRPSAARPRRRRR
jgi:Phosphotransferase enzyme family